MLRFQLLKFLLVPIIETCLGLRLTIMIKLDLPNMISLLKNMLLVLNLFISPCFPKNLTFKSHSINSSYSSRSRNAFSFISRSLFSSHWSYLFMFSRSEIFYKRSAWSYLNGNIKVGNMFHINDAEFERGSIQSLLNGTEDQDWLFPIFLTRGVAPNKNSRNGILELDF